MRFLKKGVFQQPPSPHAITKHTLNWYSFVYILHAPLIVLLAIALQGIRLDLALKWLLVAPVAVSLSFLVGYAIKRLPLARDIL